MVHDSLLQDAMGFLQNRLDEDQLTKHAGCSPFLAAHRHASWQAHSCYADGSRAQVNDLAMEDLLTVTAEVWAGIQCT